MLGAGRGQDAGQGGRLLPIQARRRLVEHQQLRFGRQGPAELDQPAVAQAERLDRQVGDVGDAEQVQDGADPGPLLGGRSAPVEQVEQQAAAALPGPFRGQQVLAPGHLREQLHALERPADAQPGSPVDRQPVDQRALESDGSRVGTLNTQQAVEQRRLAGAVRADQADHLVGVDRQADVAERGDAPEPLGDPGCFEQRHD